MLFHFGAANRRIGDAYAPEEQAHVVVDLGGCAYGASRIPCVDFLLYGDGGRNPLDLIAFRFSHAAEKLARVGAQALHIAALPFGVKRVESKR